MRSIHEEMLNALRKAAADRRRQAMAMRAAWLASQGYVMAGSGVVRADRLRDLERAGFEVVGLAKGRR